jgi:hypothetical protein
MFLFGKMAEERGVDPHTLLEVLTVFKTGLRAVAVALPYNIYLALYIKCVIVARRIHLIVGGLHA